mmetsp:Transcript_36485/g.66444  ORF Transcript_36485/g.66444 Transcript_36485/m.66444 type:complete len:213 (+) Transcript_36485:60-698(+)
MMPLFFLFLLSCLSSAAQGWQVQHSSSELNQRSGQESEIGNPSRALARFLLASNAAAAFGTSTPGLRTKRSLARHAQVGMALLKATATPENLEDFFAQAESSKGVVAVGVSEPQHFAASHVLQEVAEKYTWARLYGGPSCDIIECLLLDDPAKGSKPLEERSIDVQQLPLVALYWKGKLVKRIHPDRLEDSLTDLCRWPNQEPPATFQECWR